MSRKSELFGTVIDRPSTRPRAAISIESEPSKQRKLVYLSTKNTKTTKFLSCLFRVFRVFRGSKTTDRRSVFSFTGKFRGVLSQKLFKALLSTRRTVLVSRPFFRRSNNFFFKNRKKFGKKFFAPAFFKLDRNTTPRGKGFPGSRKAFAGRKNRSGIGRSLLTGLAHPVPTIEKQRTVDRRPASKTRKRLSEFG
ncbi:MAG: hypothetical protein JSS81_16905 [Acidobacteria bacterium]|nr:hypothetical protein [Acidobacteriota bacterium]